MYGIIIALHILASVFLILVVLIQSGRGGGVSEVFGGGSATQTIFGAKTATFLTRITAIFATVFILTSLSLTLITAKKQESLMEKVSGEVKSQPSEKQDIKGTEQENQKPQEEKTQSEETQPQETE